MRDGCRRKEFPVPPLSPCGLLVTLRPKNMRKLFYVFTALAALLQFSCGNKSLHGVHYDTTRVDTMIAVNPASNNDKDDALLHWVYASDSTLASLESKPNRKSQITAQNKMAVNVRLRKGIGTQTFLVLRDGERFAGVNNDTSCVVSVYSDGQMVGKYRYQVPPGNAADTVFIYDKVFLYNLRASSTIKIACETFTSGRLTYDFKCDKPLEWNKK